MLRREILFFTISAGLLCNPIIDVYNKKRAYHSAIYEIVQDISRELFTIIKDIILQYKQNNTNICHQQFLEKVLFAVL